jgi:hypothetical protein
VQEPDVYVYPNPARGLIRFSFPTDAARAAVNSVRAYSADGTEVYRTNSCPELIDVSAWNAGSYLIVLQTESGRIIRKIVVR